MADNITPLDEFWISQWAELEAQHGATPLTMSDAVANRRPIDPVILAALRGMIVRGAMRGHHAAHGWAAYFRKYGYFE